jgi:hypothetical protein
VRGVDFKSHEFAQPQISQMQPQISQMPQIEREKSVKSVQSVVDEFLLLDLRDPGNCRQALTLPDGATFDEVDQLAADMGGLRFRIADFGSRIANFGFEA